MGKKIPLGIGIISILILINALFGILLGILGLVGILFGGVLGAIFLTLGIILLAVGVFKLILFFALRRGKQWARVIIIILESISVFSGVFSIFSGSLFSIVSVGISGVIIYYLGFTKTAKEFFD